MNDEHVTLANEDDVLNFYRTQTCVMDRSGRLVPVGRWRAFWRRLWSWRHPPTIHMVTAIDVEAGSVTLTGPVPMRWSWLRWRWVAR